MPAAHARARPLRAGSQGASVITCWFIGLVALLLGCASEKAPRLLVLGIDGMDPVLTQQLLDEGKMPNFARLAVEGGFEPLGTSVPPQSPVAWSTFITGLDPDGHGIYDFVHRLPEQITPFLSTSRETEGAMELLRRGTPFWAILAEAGVPTKVFKVPANFPPGGHINCAFHSGCAEHIAYAGMGTPDILGTYGTFSYYTEGRYTVPDHLENGGAQLANGGQLDIAGGRIVHIELDRGKVRLPIVGPSVGEHAFSAEFTLYVDRENEVAEIELDGQRLVLQVGEWSDWLRVDYGRKPYGLDRLTGICLFYLKRTRPQIELYMSPVNIDPENPVMPVSRPMEAAAELSRAAGLYYTQGMPDDTKALEAEVFDYADFLAQDALALAERRRHLRHFLADFEQGMAFFYVHSLDQLCHMLWRTADADHPGYRAEWAPYSGAITAQYAEMDRLLGEARQLLGDDAAIVVMSDHGFAPYARAFHLNTWLVQEGYLVPQADVEERPMHVTSPGHIDWEQSRAYGLGLNSLYLNQWDREGRGIVEEMDRDALLDELGQALLEISDPVGGHQVVKEVYRTNPPAAYADTAPDLIIGYSRGYRSSGLSAVGQLTDNVIEDNLSAWSGDHCMAADEVPGVLFSNLPLGQGGKHLRDLPVSILRYYGLESHAQMRGRSIWAAPE